MRKVAIVGVEGSGKTVLMSVMGDKYESPDINGVFLQPMNRETYSYYTKETAKLRDGKWPLATESIVLELDWMLMRQSSSDAHQEKLGQISFLDFGGEVYRIAFADKSQQELNAIEEQRRNAAERLRAHVQDADVLIVLINLSDIINGKQGEDRTIEMNWLSQAILSYAYEKAGKTNVALVFTQTDLYAPTIEKCGGLRGTLAACMRTVNSRYGNRLSLFSVSAVKSVPSRDGTGAQVPIPDFKPQGLEQLIGWIVEGIDEERNRREADCAAVARDEEKRRKRWKIAAGLIGLLGILGFGSWIGYNANTDLKNFIDGHLMAWGWMHQEAPATSESRPVVVSAKPVEISTNVVPVQTKPPTVTPDPPKPKPRWIVGASNPNNPNLIAGESRDTWVANRPGYVWVRGTDRDEWKQGLRHPENSKLVSDWKEGTWKSTQAGYVWTGGNQTEWRENLKHPDWPHVLSSPEENNWHAEEGYKWVDPDAKNDFSVAWNPGKIINGRKTASSPGQWLKKCSACNGRGKKDCWKCDGDGRINCTSCSGSGRVETTESEKCWMCNGRGRITESCSNSDCIIWPNPLNPHYGKHCEICSLCEGNGGRFVPGPWGPVAVNCTACVGGVRRLCPTCGGDNKVIVDCNNCDNGYRTRQTTKKCSDCSGRGTVICPRSECHSGKVSCSSCNGDGWIAE